MDDVDQARLEILRRRRPGHGTPGDWNFLLSLLAARDNKLEKVRAEQDNLLQQLKAWESNTWCPECCEVHVCGEQGRLVAVEVLLATRDKELEEARAPRMFPLQTDRSLTGPRKIPWSIAEKAYGEYTRRFGRSQTLEGLASRGGFGWGEMDMFYPDWRKEIDELTYLQAQLAALREENERLRERADKTTAAEIAEQARLINERDELKARNTRLVRALKWICKSDGDTSRLKMEAGRALAGEESTDLKEG